MAIWSHNLNRCIGVLPELRLMVQHLVDTWQPATQDRVLTNRSFLMIIHLENSHGWRDRDMIFDC